MRLQFALRVYWKERVVGPELRSCGSTVFYEIIDHAFWPEPIPVRTKVLLPPCGQIVGGSVQTSSKEICKYFSVEKSRLFLLSIAWQREVFSKSSPAYYLLQYEKQKRKLTYSARIHGYCSNMQLAGRD